MSRTARGTDRWWSDLALAGGLTVAAAIAMLVPGVPEPIRWALGLPLLLILPGYGVVAALLPDAPEERGRSPNRAPRSPGWAVRFGLAVVSTVVAVASVGIALSATVGIRLAPAAVGIAGLTLALYLVAAIRRLAVPANARANPLGGPGGATLSLGSTTFQTAATILALAALASAVAFAGATPTDGDGYSEFYVLTSDAEGNLTVTDMPERIRVGADQPLHFGIENEEGRVTTYEVVVRGEGSTSGESTVLDRFETQVDAGERVVVERAITPETEGETRVQALLYKGSAPGDPTVENADVSLRLWLEAVEGPES